ncbi:sec-independent protein translocase protein TATA, chloroplastic [Andrographis paniculata]|uniref:sec-independent protein translocase protein TATA, chloroplastic n=1 Tax=Andrographis paniculata TaxID=175694 RepID=UPI0021E82CC8|nr:sec-independent protein translocase protein TATA, chloroplastic [Andrographis paniculata]
MAAVSSALATAASPRPNIPTRLAPLSSSNSIFFSYNVCSRARLGISVSRHRAAKKRGMSCNCLFGLGVPELAVIAGVAVLLFGPKKLPEVGRSIGKTVKGFQQAAKEFESELKKEDETSAEQSSEKVTTVSEEERDDKVGSTKETS